VLAIRRHGMAPQHGAGEAVPGVSEEGRGVARWVCAFPGADGRAWSGGIAGSLAGGTTVPGGCASVAGLAEGEAAEGVGEQDAFLPVCAVDRLWTVAGSARLRRWTRGRAHGRRAVWGELLQRGCFFAS